MENVVSKEMLLALMPDCLRAKRCCQTCQHWDTGAESTPVRQDRKLYGDHIGLCHCSKIGIISESLAQEPSLEDVPRDGLAAVLGDPYNSATLYTGPDFSCLHWTPNPSLKP